MFEPLQKKWSPTPPKKTQKHWTWQHAGKGEVKSCLDLALAFANLLPFGRSMIIYKKRDFPARRIIKKKSGTVTICWDIWMLAHTYERLTKEAEDKVKHVTSG